ncbi:uncharacterized protein LOC116346177 isoform X2 [Contarinia nasturtii]|uniref:uncharacterized protein LOC116346177 isoform X2 n=1 Tax=Contarinia nasturtii TaxID=265458 RepID=UPI0012D423F7|nr:uncharacterized protein LOC116346177 isoform X2 [Contarinia nasturtii]
MLIITTLQTAVKFQVTSFGSEAHVFIRLSEQVQIPCYKHPNDSPQSLFNFPDILDAEKQPLPGKSIFFHVETSCNADGIAELNAKQACVIESAARWNPNRDVFVIFASPVGIRDYPHWPPFIEQLKEYDNIYFRNMNLWLRLKNGPKPLNPFALTIRMSTCPIILER